MITTVYRVRLDFEYPRVKRGGCQIEACRKLDDEILTITKEADCAEIFTGNAACGPYVFAEYLEMRDAQDVETKLTALLKKRKAIA